MFSARPLFERHFQDFFFSGKMAAMRPKVRVTAKGGFEVKLDKREKKEREPKLFLGAKSKKRENRQP